MVISEVKKSTVEVIKGEPSSSVIGTQAIMTTTFEEKPKELKSYYAKKNDQFQLAIDSHDITTIRTPIGLMRMCTLPQGATNSVAHMVNTMNNILRDFVPKVTMPFLDVRSN